MSSTRQLGPDDQVEVDPRALAEALADEPLDLDDPFQDRHDERSAGRQAQAVVAAVPKSQGVVAEEGRKVVIKPRASDDAPLRPQTLAEGAGPDVVRRLRAARPGVATTITSGKTPERSRGRRALIAGLALGLVAAVGWWGSARQAPAAKMAPGSAPEGAASSVAAFAIDAAGSKEAAAGEDDAESAAETPPPIAIGSASSHGVPTAGTKASPAKPIPPPYVTGRAVPSTPPKPPPAPQATPTSIRVF